MNKTILNSITDICQRVFGVHAKVVVKQDELARCVVIDVTPQRQQDALTQSQQEMDVILSVQYILQRDLNGVSWSVHLTLH